MSDPNIVKLSTRRPSAISVLHVLASLDRGGAETWLIDVVRYLSAQGIRMDVCVLKTHEGKYEGEFKALGGTIHRCPLGKNPLLFARNFRRLLRDTRYDVVHSHVYYFSGLILRVAAKAGVPTRIAHNHPVEDVKQEKFGRRVYTHWMKRWMMRYATHFLGPTRASLESLWGSDWHRDSNKQVIYNGLNVDRFRQVIDRDKVRAGLGMPPEAKIVLNVARFAPHKRQKFLVDVAQSIIGARRDVFFVLVGAGPLREEVMAEVERRRLTGSFRFIEGLPNIDHLWLAADLFAFPSVNEGFGIVVAEAAAAGLPVVACDILGLREAAQACHRVRLLPLESDATAWKAAVLEALDYLATSNEERRTMLERFPFTVESSAASLLHVYGCQSMVASWNR